MLQLTGVVADRDMRAQYLDRMDIERERGITIKAQNVRLPWRVSAGPNAGEEHVLDDVARRELPENAVQAPRMVGPLKADDARLVVSGGRRDAVGATRTNLVWFSG